MTSKTGGTHRDVSGFVDWAEGYLEDLRESGPTPLNAEQRAIRLRRILDDDFGRPAGWWWS